MKTLDEIRREELYKAAGVSNFVEYVKLRTSDQKLAGSKAAKALNKMGLKTTRGTRWTSQSARVTCEEGWTSHVS